MLNKKIPYYGKYNSIDSVSLSEDKKTFLVTRYDDKGKVKEEIFKIPNKKTNQRLLAKDYYQDVSEYLEKNKNKYEEYSKEKKLLKKDISLKTIKNILKILTTSIVVSAILIAASFYFLTLIALYYIGASMLVISAVGTLLAKDILKEVKRNEFTKNYKEFKNNLKKYQSSIENENKNSLTEYHGLHKEKNKGNDLQMKKIRLKQDKAA